MEPLEKNIVVGMALSVLSFIWNVLVILSNVAGLHIVNELANFVFFLGVIALPLWIVSAGMFYIKMQTKKSLYYLSFSVVLGALYFGVLFI